MHLLLDSDPPGLTDQNFDVNTADEKISFEHGHQAEESNCMDETNTYLQLADPGVSELKRKSLDRALRHIAAVFSLSRLNYAKIKQTLIETRRIVGNNSSDS